MIKKNRTKKRKNFLFEQYAQSFDYIRESQKYIWAVVLIFLIFVVVGFFVMPEMIRNWFVNYMTGIVEKTKDFNSAGDWILFIFLNNVTSSIIGIVLGFLFGAYPLFGAVANGYIMGFVSNMAAVEAGFGSLLRLLPHGVFELPAIFISFGLGLKFGSDFIRENILKKKYWLIILAALTLIFYVVVLVSTLVNPGIFDVAISQSDVMSGEILILLMAPVYFGLATLVFVFVLLDSKLREIFFDSLRVFVFVVLPLLIIAAIIEGYLIFVSI